MEIIIVDEQFKGSLENQIEQSLIRLKKDILEQGLKIGNVVKLNVFIKTEDNVEFFEIKEEVGQFINF